MTEKLYYKDAFIKEFTAKVLDCREEKDAFLILLDRTAFFPEGGGQFGDSGKIGDVEIFDTHESGGEVWHYAKAAVTVGEVARCKIDFEKRFRRMQCHSGEHIVSGLLHSLYGIENVGFHLGDSDVTIDTSAPLSEEQIRNVEKLANEAVAKDFEIRAFFPTAGEAASIAYRAKLEITEGLRLVEFPGYDICACCAPHVSRSGQIGVIKLLDFAHYKGGMRIHMLCGGMALDDYHSRYSEVQKISVMLSAKQNEVAAAAKRLKNENEANLAKLGAMKKEYAALLAESAKETDGNLIFFVPSLDGAALRSLVNAALPKCGGICAAFSGEDGAYNFCMASSTLDLKACSKEIGDALKGRCGGSKEMISGSVKASRKEIEEYF